MKIAINGFGRIGRLFMRACLERQENVEFVAVNDLTSSENLAYLFKYDTTYGRFDGEVGFENDQIIINYKGKESKVRVLAQKDPALLPWKEMEVDLVVESTGFFLTRELASKHLEAGAKKVLLSAPAKSSDIPTVVLGVNTVPDTGQILSNASCTTNCIAPAIKAISDSLDLDFVSGVTIHAYTASQNLQDGPNKKMRTGRAAAENTVPTSTGADDAVIAVLPNLSGKLSVSAVRVPVVTGSYVYLTFQTKTEVDKQEIMNILNAYSAANPQIMEISTDPLVSSDVAGNSRSCIVDAEMIRVTGDGRFEMGLWYDNEWGYTNRLIDAAIKFGA